MRSLISNSFRFSDPLRLAHTMLCRHTMPPANAQDVRLRRLSSAFSLPSGGEDFTNMVQFDCHSEQAFFAQRRIWASRAKRRASCDAILRVWPASLQTAPHLN